MPKAGSDMGYGEGRAHFNQSRQVLGTKPRPGWGPVSCLSDSINSRTKVPEQKLAHVFSDHFVKNMDQKTEEQFCYPLFTVGGCTDPAVYATDSGVSFHNTATDADWKTAILIRQYDRSHT